MKNLEMFFASLFLSMFAFNANAALVAADLTALGTEVTTDVGVVKDAVLPLIFLIIALTIGIKILKKLTSKI